jgi:predicted house-cleaning noncanonical NTP pyrophosphatase (MazG superfamily)
MEKNGYLIPHPNKTKINNTKEPREAHKNTLKKDILQVITDNFMEKMLDVVKQNVQDALRNFKTPKIKNMRRHKNK